MTTEDVERKPPSRGIEVKLLGHTQDPIRSLYLAYRTAYSALTPLQIDARIEDERITREQMVEFIEKRLQTGHASPLEQVWFEFGIAGVTRAFSHQFVRHHMGISFEQQSQRYVTFKGGEFPYTVPESVKKSQRLGEFVELFDQIARVYDQLIKDGIPAEDARFVLPNAANTNFKVNVNLLELLHIADLRLCTRAQWEFRKVVALMRAQLIRNKDCEALARYMQPKCGEHRLGYCDEPYEDWEKCPIGRKRPHKTVLFDAYDDLVERIGDFSPEYGTRAKSGSIPDQVPLFDTTSLVEQRRPRAQYKDLVRRSALDEHDFDLIQDEDSSVGR